MSRPSTPATENDACAAEAVLWSMRLAEGRLAAHDHASFQAWLDADASHAEAMAQVVDAWRVVESYAAAPAMLDLRQRALASAQRALAQAQFTRRTRKIWAPLGRNWRGAAIAASLALAVLAGAGWVWLMPSVYETGLGERRVVALSDGSKISLDAETLVKVRYAFGRRQLWLERGRAKFDVAKDATRPFTVDAGGREVVATGTSFSVELVRRQVRVILYQGHVAVVDTAGRHAYQPVISVGSVHAPADRLLTPGHELVTTAAAAADNSQTPTATVAAVDPIRSLSWEAGQLVFDDEPLSLAIERMNRYASTPLAIADPQLGRLRISGVFRAGDSEAFAEGLTAEFPVRATTKGDRIVFSQASAKNNGP